MSKNLGHISSAGTKFYVRSGFDTNDWMKIQTRAGYKEVRCACCKKNLILPKGSLRHPNDCELTFVITNNFDGMTNFLICGSCTKSRGLRMDGPMDHYHDMQPWSEMLQEIYDDYKRYKEFVKDSPWKK